MIKLTNFIHTPAIAVMLLLVLSVHAIAQVEPQYNVPSPEVASLGVYGQIPVSNFTGVPEISVPLYEVEVGSYKLPITASYHINSVKPNSIPGPLGMGWNLIAGGYITRHVRGVYDEIMDANGNQHGYYAFHNAMQNISQSTFTYHMSFFNDSEVWHEISADIFSFSFCGYSGNFFLDEYGNWTVISDQDIKVELSAGEEFLSINEVGERIKFGSWRSKSSNQRYFKKFRLTTPDGAQYEFGGLNAMEFSAPYYSRNSNNLVASTWRLAKIITPEKHQIEFTYDTSAITCELHYVPKYMILYNITAELTDPYKYGLSAFTGFLIFPVNIKSITTPNETINFSYVSDNSFEKRIYPNGIKALYWMPNENSPSNMLSDSFVPPSTRPEDEFFIFMNHVNRGDSPNETRRNFAKAMKHYMLNNISIVNSDEDFNKKINFFYQSAGRKSLIGISFSKDNDQNNSSTAGLPTYGFTYNMDKKMPENFIVAKTDSWGYYNGGTHSISSPCTSFDIIEPDASATRAEILTGITHPTGGMTEFEYELNSYSSYVDPTAMSIVSKSGKCGGLRIKKITRKKTDGTTEGSKIYYYSKERPSTNAQPSSGIMKAMPIHSIGYNFLNNNARFEQKSIEPYQQPATSLNSPDVGYSWVIEENLDANGVSLGYTRYHYSNYDADIDGRMHLDSIAVMSSGILNNNSCISPKTSLSIERGKLLSMEFFSSNGTLMRKETNRYLRTEHRAAPMAYQETMFFGVNEFGNPIFSTFGWVANTLTASFLPASSTDTIYTSTAGGTLASKHEYLYNTHKSLSRDTYSLSNGQTGFTTYRYPFDIVGYDNLINAGITSPVIEKISSEGGLSITERNDFNLSIKGAPYLSRKSITLGGGQPKIEYEVLHTDDYGNPQDILSKGMHTILLWGYSGQRLLARIENGDYDAIKSRFNLNGSSSATLYSYGTLVNAFPETLVHTYSYNKKLLPVAITTPNGQTTYYNYDIMGRLRRKYFIDSMFEPKTLNIYDYKYYHH